jgi:hypothetical protein
MELLETQSLWTDAVPDQVIASPPDPHAALHRAKPTPSLLVNLLLFALVASYCVWVFSLPLFPTQDGAIHLYYAQVLSHLLSGPSVYSQFFAIRHPIPPYAFHYALLLGLSKFIQPLVAEQVVVCLTIVTFVYGFRAFSRNLGPSADIVTLWAVPLSLNWMLGMGFHNFCLSMGLGLWTAAAWLRAVRTRSLRSWLLYCAFLVVILFTHPVPLLITVAFITCELLLRMSQLWSAGQAKQNLLNKCLHYGRTDILFAIFSGLTLLYVTLFVKHDTAPRDLHAFHMPMKTVMSLAALKTLTLVGKTRIGYAYRLSFYPILLIAIASALCGFRQRWSTRRFTVSDLILFGSLVLGIAVPLLPRSVNGSDYFADRLIIYVWIGALAAAACFRFTNRRSSRTVSAVAVFFSLTALALADHYVRPVSKQIAAWESVHSHPPGQFGIFLDSPGGPTTSTISFDPYLWAAARYFRRTDTVLLNAPWLELPVLPIAPRGSEFANRFTYLNDYPDHFRELLMYSAASRASVAGLAQFIVAEQDFTSGKLDPLLSRQWPHPLTCEHINWQSLLCQPAGLATLAQR